MTAATQMLRRPVAGGRTAAAVVAALALVSLLTLDWLTAGMPLDNLRGFVLPNFDKVEKVFRKNFHDGWEREGASVAVYYKVCLAAAVEMSWQGELVVDLSGGWMDKSAGRKWTDETRTVVFSTTKAVGALCIALLVDRGYLRYEDRVADFWPEFAQHGKANVTVDWVMSHRAGLAAFDSPVDLESARDPTKMASIIEQQEPNWEPGTKHGYHAITFGWLVDQIVRRTDPKGRSVGQFFREEIAKPFGIDFHLGLPASEEHTVSRLSLPSTAHLLKEIVHDPRVLIVLAIFHLRFPGSIAHKIRENPQWFKLEQDVNTFNAPELHQIEQAAALGITKARDLAKMFALFLDGKIVGKELVARFAEPQIASGIDEVVMVPLPKGHGFMYERHPSPGRQWLFGHPGYGGSTVMMDPHEDVVIAYDAEVRLIVRPAENALQKCSLRMH